MSGDRRRWWALAGLTLAVLAVGLDMTVLSVALPTLASSLHASEADLQWFSSGYMLVLAAGMLPMGVLGDRFGRRLVMLVALALFGVGSAACAYSRSPGAFLAARLLLGLAGAGVVVMALAAVTVLFDEKERPRAVGVWAAANFLALPIGPILGGWLLSHYWWGSVFLLNTPVAIIGLLATLMLVPESRSPRPPSFDALGLTASVAGLSALTYGLIEAGQRGWATAAAAGPIVVGAVLLLAFWSWQRRLARQPAGQPLLDPALFRSRSYTGGVILAAVAGLAMVGVLFALPQYFQGVLGTDAMGSGMRLLPLIAGLTVGVVPADSLGSLVGPKRVAVLGFVVLAAGLLLGTATGVHTGYTFTATWTAIVGVGMGLAMATAASVALAGLPAEHSGVGSAALQALNKVGGPFGSAVVGSILSAAYVSRLDLVGLPAAAVRAARDSVFGGIAVAQRTHSATLRHVVQAAFIHGMDRALLVSGIIAVVGVVLTLAFLPRTAPARPGTTAAGRDRSHQGADVGATA